MSDTLPVYAWLMEYGAVSLPHGDPSRITEFQAFHTLPDMLAASDATEFDNIGQAVVRLSDAQAAIAASEARADAALNAQIEAEARFATLTLGKNLAEVRAEAAEARIAELARRAGRAANRLEAAEAEIAALSATLAASCDDEREQKWEATTGGGCSRAIAAEAERDALRRALELIAAGDFDDARRDAQEALASASPTPVGSGEPT